MDNKTLAAWEIPRRAVVRVKQIGSGQFGDVFEGSYGGQQVAIKTLKDVDDENTKSFLSEAGVMTCVAAAPPLCLTRAQQAQASQSGAADWRRHQRPARHDHLRVYEQGLPDAARRAT